MKNIFSVKWVYFFSYIVMITPSNETLSCFHRLDFRISFWFAFPLRMGNTDEYISYSRFLNLIYLLFNHHCFLRKRLICMLKLKLFWQLDQECELVLPELNKISAWWWTTPNSEGTMEIWGEGLAWCPGGHHSESPLCICLIIKQLLT